MKRKVLFSGIFIILVCLYVVQFYNINHKYPPSQLISYTQNQTVIYDGFSINVQKTTFLNDTELKTIHKDFYNSIYVENEEMKAIVVDIQITNTNQQDEQIDVSDVWLQSNYWVNGIVMNGFVVINPENASLNPSLKPGETITLRLPFAMIPAHFKEKDWNHTSDRKYNLVLSAYPVKRMLEIN